MSENLQSGSLVSLADAQWSDLVYPQPDPELSLESTAPHNPQVSVNSQPRHR